MILAVSISLSKENLEATRNTNLFTLAASSSSFLQIEVQKENVLDILKNLYEATEVSNLGVHVDVKNLGNIYFHRKTVLLYFRTV